MGGEGWEEGWEKGWEKGWEEGWEKRCIEDEERARAA